MFEFIPHDPATGSCGRCGSAPDARDDTCPNCTPTITERKSGPAWVDHAMYGPDNAAVVGITSRHGPIANLGMRNSKTSQAFAETLTRLLNAADGVSSAAISGLQTGDLALLLKFFGVRIEVVDGVPCEVIDGLYYEMSEHEADAYQRLRMLA